LFHQLVVVAKEKHAGPNFLPIQASGYNPAAVNGNFSGNDMHAVCWFVGSKYRKTSHLLKPLFKKPVLVS
jgi:hypothetical protein